MMKLVRVMLTQHDDGEVTAMLQECEGVNIPGLLPIWKDVRPLKARRAVDGSVTIEHSVLAEAIERSKEHE